MTPNPTSTAGAGGGDGSAVTVPRVPAVARLGDRSVPFDAADWLATASVTEVETLAKAEWAPQVRPVPTGRANHAERVTQSLIRAVPALSALRDAAPATEQDVTVSVDKVAALRFLAAVRWEFITARAIESVTEGQRRTPPLARVDPTAVITWVVIVGGRAHQPGQMAKMAARRYGPVLTSLSLLSLAEKTGVADAVVDSMLAVALAHGAKTPATVSPEQVRDTLVAAPHLLDRARAYRGAGMRLDEAVALETSAAPPTLEALTALTALSGGPRDATAVLGDEINAMLLGLHPDDE